MVFVLLSGSLLAWDLGSVDGGWGEEEQGEQGQESAMDAEADFQYITSHVDLAAPRVLTVSSPSEEETETASANFYLTGSSDPARPLYLNGAEMERRGIQGSFGVYLSLEEGPNVFLLEQGEVRREVTITRLDGAPAEAAAAEGITQMWPLEDEAVRAGTTVTLRCVAPSGGVVTAWVQGMPVELKQNAGTEADSIPAVYTGNFEPAEVEGTVDLGPVEYTLESGESFASEGSLFAAGSDSVLLVQAKAAASVIFAGEVDDTVFLGTALEGAVDYVEEIGEIRYKLAMGGWVPKDTVQPLEEGEYLNEVRRTEARKVEKGEEFLFHGASHPFYTASLTENALTITFYHTSGIGDVPVAENGLIETVSVKESGGHTKLTFAAASPGSLWGYQVEHGNGVTTLYCKEKPILAPGGEPLAGMVIVLDPGHGGDDIGAEGIAGENGPNEAQINYASAVAVQKRLELLGAEVILTREAGSGAELGDRLRMVRKARPDLFLSLHSNSIATGADGTRPTGVEVYYFEETAQALAENMEYQLCSYAGRTSRGAKRDYYRVTLYSGAPAVMIEMGFITSPREFDDLCSKEGIYATANAVANGVLALFS